MTAFFTSGTAALLFAAALAAEPLRLSVYPSYSRAPAVVRIQAIVEPVDQRRSLLVEIDSGGYYRSSTIQLPGVRAARVHAVNFAAVPAGEYEVRVGLVDDRGERSAIQYARVMVLE